MNTLPSLPLIEGAFFVSGTFIEWLSVCQTGASYYKLDARVPDITASAPLFGQHLHSALALRARLQEHSLSAKQVDDICLRHLEDLFNATPTQEGDWRNLNWAQTLLQEHNKRFPATCYEMLQYNTVQKCRQCKGRGYFEQQLEDRKTSTVCQWCHATGQQRAMVEVPFALPLATINGLPIVYHGFIDLPVRCDKQLFEQDYKSTSMLGESFWDQQRASAAQKGYCWSLQTLTGEKVHGYIIRSLRTKEPPKYVTEGIANHKGESKTITSWFDEGIQEQRFLLGTDELDQWHSNTCLLIEEFLWHHARGKMPMRTSNCAGKFGKCAYWDVCYTFPAEQRKNILSSGLYKDKEQATK